MQSRAKKLRATPKKKDMTAELLRRGGFLIFGEFRTGKIKKLTAYVELQVLPRLEYYIRGAETPIKKLKP